MRHIWGDPITWLDIREYAHLDLAGKLKLTRLTEKEGLVAPLGYWLLLPEEKAAICNGAGSRGFGWAVPDDCYGVSLTPAADTHDYCWHVGMIGLGNRIFRQNMLSLIDRERDDWSPLRRRRVRTYYLAVTYVGAPLYRLARLIGRSPK